jgi:hypothetical protein
VSRWADGAIIHDLCETLAVVAINAWAQRVADRQEVRAKTTDEPLTLVVNKWDTRVVTTRRAIISTTRLNFLEEAYMCIVRTPETFSVNLIETHFQFRAVSVSSAPAIIELRSRSAVSSLKLLYGSAPE